MPRPLPLFEVLAFASLGLLGCGGGDAGRTVTVEGKVTLVGKPVGDASIHFVQSRTGADFGADLEPDGSYSVELLAAKPKDEYDVFLGPVMAPPAEPKLDGAGLPLPNPPPSLPKRYLDPATSQIDFVLEEGSSAEKDVPLTN